MWHRTLKMCFLKLDSYIGVRKLVCNNLTIVSTAKNMKIFAYRVSKMLSICDIVCQKFTQSQQYVFKIFEISMYDTYLGP